MAQAKYMYVQTTDGNILSGCGKTFWAERVQSVVGGMKHGPGLGVG